MFRMNINEEKEGTDVRYINLATMHGEGEYVCTSIDRTSPPSSSSKEHSSREPSSSSFEEHSLSIHPTPSYPLLKSTTSNDTKQTNDDFIHIEDGYHDENTLPTIAPADVMKQKVNMYMHMCIFMNMYTSMHICIYKCIYIRQVERIRIRGELYLYIFIEG
jgi:hypothetical protein